MLINFFLAFIVPVFNFSYFFKVWIIAAYNYHENNYLYIITQQYCNVIKSKLCYNMKWLYLHKIHRCTIYLKWHYLIKCSDQIRCSYSNAIVFTQTHICILCTQTWTIVIWWQSFYVFFLHKIYLQWIIISWKNHGILLFNKKSSAKQCFYIKTSLF